ncbi:hypothetical protein [Streptomyces sp. ZAF1911]|uniref:hypothetical protein n=1 Tax=Streptomyces sp. ZAF1911 TaxID=2944129 RepID=UPI0030B80B0F
MTRSISFQVSTAEMGCRAASASPAASSDSMSYGSATSWSTMRDFSQVRAAGVMTTVS